MTLLTIYLNVGLVIMVFATYIPENQRRLRKRYAVRGFWDLARVTVLTVVLWLPISAALLVAARRGPR